MNKLNATWRSLALGATIAVSSCGQVAAPTVTLVPEGYEGPVFILFAHADGSAPTYESGVRLFKIPPEGVLREKEWGPRGAVRSPDDKYYFQSSSGARTPIPIAEHWTSPYTSQMTAAELDRASLFFIELGNIQNSQGDTIYFASFLVGPLRHVDALVQQRERALHLLR